MILGYPGLSEVMLAMERGEVDGHPSPYWSYLKSAKPDWIRDKKVSFQYGGIRNPELPDVPFAYDLASNDADRALLGASLAPLAMGYPFFMGPAVPRERVMAIRKAFADTFMDSSFLADAASQNLDIAPISGEDVEKTLQDTYAIGWRFCDVCGGYTMATIRSELGIVDFRPATVLRFSD